ncbi:nitrate/nitrite transporter NarK [Aquabacter spiritensis]|uniref:Nitrate/nitrite transporter NarK n=2 Tax=Aquabacter spiritensis TaxID=933073 RepID=A0A4R3M9D0_9HYPH|nr:nitrate/nitrite transporter NarK [Aquabacter spiritensis]
MLLQATASFLNQMLPTLAPILQVELGWPDTLVGYLVALSTIGAIAFLVAGGPLVRGAGPIRAVQAGLGLGMLGVALLQVPVLVAPLLASILIGLAYGPSTPAGSDVLMRYAPVRHRTLIFSLKQAGVPLGGALAGLLLPLLAAAFGWRAALWGVIGILAAAVLAVQGVRGRVDAGRDRSRLRMRLVFSPANVREPFAALAAGQSLRRIALAGGFLAMAQGGWNAFLVTYLVRAVALSPVQAGLVFAVMQTAGAFGRIGIGWLADRVGSGISVTRASAASAGAATLALGLAGPDWPLPALLGLAGIAGLTVSGWNGVQLAEIARRAPRHLVGEASAGGTVFVFLGFVAGPSVFAMLLALTGRYDVPCFALAAMPLVAVALLTGVRRA